MWRSPKGAEVSQEGRRTKGGTRTGPWACHGDEVVSSQGGPLLHGPGRSLYGFAPHPAFPPAAITFLFPPTTSLPPNHHTSNTSPLSYPHPSFPHVPQTRSKGPHLGHTL